MEYNRKEYRKAYCNQRNIKSVLWLAEYYEKKGNEEQMVKYYERAARRNSLEANVKLGDYYEKRRQENKMEEVLLKVIKMKNNGSNIYKISFDIAYKILIKLYYKYCKKMDLYSKFEDLIFYGILNGGRNVVEIYKIIDFDYLSNEEYEYKFAPKSKDIYVKLFKFLKNNKMDEAKYCKILIECAEMHYSLIAWEELGDINFYKDYNIAKEYYDKAIENNHDVILKLIKLCLHHNKYDKLKKCKILADDIIRNNIDINNLSSVLDLKNYYEHTKLYDKLFELNISLSSSDNKVIENLGEYGLAKEYEFNNCDYWVANKQYNYMKDEFSTDEMKQSKEKFKVKKNIYLNLYDSDKNSDKNECNICNVVERRNIILKCCKKEICKKCIIKIINTNEDKFMCPYCRFEVKYDIKYKDSEIKHYEDETDFDLETDESCSEYSDS